MNRIAVLFLAVFACSLVGCGSVPHELVVANATEKQAAQALERDEVKIIKGYDAEVRRLAGQLLDAQRAAKLRAAVIAAIPAERLARIDAARDAAVAARKPFAEADAARTAALNAASADVAVPLSSLEAIDAASSAERAEIMATWERKREALLDAPNREILFEMNAAVGRYLGSLDSAARELEQLVERAGKVK